MYICTDTVIIHNYDISDFRSFEYILCMYILFDSTNPFMIIDHITTDESSCMQAKCPSCTQSALSLSYHCYMSLLTYTIYIILILKSDFAVLLRFREIREILRNLLRSVLLFRELVTLWCCISTKTQCIK